MQLHSGRNTFFIGVFQPLQTAPLSQQPNRSKQARIVWKLNTGTGEGALSGSFQRDKSKRAPTTEHDFNALGSYAQLLAYINIEPVDVMMFIITYISGCTCKHGRLNYRAGSTAAICILNPKRGWAFVLQILLGFRGDRNLGHRTSLLIIVRLLAIKTADSIILYSLFAVNIGDTIII